MIDESQHKIAWGISVGSMYWSACGLPPSDNDSLREIHRQGVSTPASVLLGYAPGEPPRLDCWIPPHPRGTASDWPPEAIVNVEKGSGRFPLAAAWTGRHYELPWRWKPDLEYRQLDSLDALCFGTAQLAKLHARKAPAAIVIPNDFRQREQQKLLDACSAAGVDAALIWLPVAAALAWLEYYSQTIPVAAHQSDGRLIIHVVHADWGRVRCSTLNLVVRTDEFGCRWMPARNRPSVSDWDTPGFGWSSIGGCNTKNASEVWRNLFGSRDRGIPVNSDSDSNLLQQIVHWQIDQSTPHEVDLKLAAHLAKGPSITAVIFVGDFARQVASGQYVARALRSSTTCVLNGREGEDFVSRGAFIFLRARLQKRTSYLDTLPNLELFVDRGTHYDWLQLLGDSDLFVPGGQQWELQQPIDGLAVRRGASSIKLVVAHDEYPGVRELQITLDRPAEVDLGASLQVSATPAQGNARLLLTTAATNGITSRSILANWERMTKLFEKDNTTPLDKKTFEQSRPKAFPNLRPRPADPDRWNSFATRTKSLLDEVEEANQLSRRGLALNRILISAKIASGKSAVSSEGLAPYARDQKIVDKLAKLLFEYIRNRDPARILNQASNLAEKILGNLSVSLDGLDKWILEAIGQPGNIDETTCSIAGNCIRSPEVAAVFVNRLISRIPLSNHKRLLNYQMQALGRLLSQRQDIMSKIPEKLAYQLVHECLMVFADQIEKDRLAWLFEHSGLVVVYTLRYRIYNPDFLTPESDLAIKAKQQFELAIAKLSMHVNRQRRSYYYGNLSPERAGRLRTALQQLIDYIDKRGEGDILLALED